MASVLQRVSTFEPPTLGRDIVRRPGFYPTRPRAALFFLPERRARLEIVHDELAGCERIAAVRARHDYEDDLVGGLEKAHPVYDERVVNAPAAFGLPHYLLDGPLRHSRIVLEAHFCHRISFIDVAHDADEARHRADLGVPAAQRGDLGAHVEIGD